MEENVDIWRQMKWTILCGRPSAAWPTAALSNYVHTSCSMWNVFMRKGPKRWRQPTCDWNVFNVNERRSWHVRAITKIRNVRKEENRLTLTSTNYTACSSIRPGSKTSGWNYHIECSSTHTHNTRVCAFSRVGSTMAEWENGRERIRITMKIDDQMKNFTLGWLLPNH